MIEEIPDPVYEVFGHMRRMGDGARLDFIDGSNLTGPIFGVNAIGILISEWKNTRVSFFPWHVVQEVSWNDVS